ncbi:Gfo/Idh/MocA family oxidoreductase [Anaerofustis butyriciformans]|uniref:Gfo/Idh/MocA family protein n=1 Tax=Anaerofustis butyriciformans TaxID=3108533 RepID=UPI002E37CF02|nr:Gfo/Idh/MocA family oxidoreductase [Anaerofustis sp. HA2171]
MVKYGILSTASIVPRFVKGVRESENGEVVAIASRGEEKAKQKAEELNIGKYYGSYEELYNDDEVDVIYIATINFAHYQNIKDALNAGKHVVCEKPLVLEKKQAEELFELAKEKNLFLAEAQKEVFLPVTNKVKEIIKEKQIGEIGLMDFATSFPGDYNAWTLDLSKGGGVFFTNAVYCIEYIEYVLGKPISEYFGMRLKSEEFGGDKECTLNFKIGNDTLATSKISGYVKLLNKLFIYGSEGYIEMDNFYKADKMTIHYYDDRDNEEVYHPATCEMTYEINHFNSCIIEGKLTSDVITKEMTIHNVEILENIQNSWK